MSDDGKSSLKKNEKPPTGLLREEAIDIDGAQIIISTEAYVRKPDGSVLRQKRHSHQMAADGRSLRVDEFVAVSWTALAVPQDSLGACLNPFEGHEFRPVYLNLDGYVTRRGNVLCQECFERQKRKLFWKRVLLFGLIYNPPEY